MNKVLLTEITEEKILFFDMDETLIKTDFANFLAYQEAIYSIVKLDLKIKFDPSNRFNRNELKKVIPHLTKEQYLNIILAKEKNFIKYLKETELRNDIVNILLRYSITNKTILVTKSRKSRAIALLNYFELLNKFDEIFCLDSLQENSKANKFQNAITKLGVTADKIVVFENEESEILLASKIGIRIINPKMDDYDAKV